MNVLNPRTEKLSRHCCRSFFLITVKMGKGHTCTFNLKRLNCYCFTKGENTTKTHKYRVITIYINGKNSKYECYIVLQK